MTRRFGWCTAPTGARPQHDKCPREYAHEGRTRRCGCRCHERGK